MTVTPEQEWWTAQEIAASGLPDLPTSARQVHDLAKRRNWRAMPRLARRRSGPGRPWEYSWKLFPNTAQRALLKQAIAPKAAAARARDAARSKFEALSAPAPDAACCLATCPRRDFEYLALLPTDLPWFASPELPRPNLSAVWRQ